MTIFEAKKNIIQKIKAHSESPALDAEVLLQELLGKDKTYILMHRDEEISDKISREQILKLNEWTAARAKGIPVAYIVGKKEFYGLDFFVDQNVLIPKPDTEILVARAFEILSERISKNENAILTVCDMCTGSGCVALSVMRSLLDDERVPLSRLPYFTLVDISAAALDIARKNARSLLSGQRAGALERVRFVQSNLFERLGHGFDMVLSNPPYIPQKEARALLQDGRSEPLLALDGDVTETGDASKTDDGLAVFRRLAVQAAERLTAGGDFLCETGEYNADAAADFLRGLPAKSRSCNGEGTSSAEDGARAFCDIGIELDLEGQKRVVFARKNHWT